ncbi:MAG: phenylalanine--tRNA ligase subunit beta [Chloroflexi bacterium]|nr:phenylalanine--tRNA ligase subunit beta [Chloroflexota bacterium]
MKVPLSWLKSYVPIEMPPKELAHRLTMAGLETTGVEVIGAEWENIVVGHVLEVARHPNADRLRLATVDLGGEKLTVVCGAPNVAAGQRIAFAKVGATPIDAHTGKRERLQAARIRGVVSQGMICSARELGISDEHTGILVLDENAPIGAPLADLLGDAVLDTEPTTNRPDWLSVLGVAREVGAIATQMVDEPTVSYGEEGPAIESMAKVYVDAPDLAPRYTASLILGVKIGPSPEWMQQRLSRAGQRPINNLVDITNYVMLEYGQPLHAFDYDRLAEHTVRVRRAAPGELLVTLDGQSRRLTTDMLVIADAHTPVGLAGVMGGANSEVTEATTNILLESATFNPSNIRRTANALRHRTDASTRFERGLNPGLAPIGLRRATQLLTSIAGGRAAKGIIDLYPGTKARAPLVLTLARVRKVLGVDYDLRDCLRALLLLGITSEPKGEDTLVAHVPYWRSDLNIEDDLVEEIARVRGYDSIPMTFMAHDIPPRRPNPRRELKERVRDLLAQAGMQETISYAVTSIEALQAVQDLGKVGRPLRLQNPMSTRPEAFRAARVQDTLKYREHMRTTLRAGILETLASNQRFVPAEAGLRLFEVGRVYLPREGELPDEREMATGVLWGNRQPLGWSTLPSSAKGEGQERGAAFDFFDAKGVVEAVLTGLRLSAEYAPIPSPLAGEGIGGRAVLPSPAPGEGQDGGDPLLLPGRAASVIVGGTRISVIGEVRPAILDTFGAGEGAVAFFELDLDALLPLLPQSARAFAPLAEYPGAYRDLALLADAGVPAAQVEAVIRRHPLVESVALFDVFTGGNVPAGKRSLAYRIHYQSAKGTLTSEAVAAAQEHILRELQRETGATLRG